MKGEIAVFSPNVYGNSDLPYVNNFTLVVKSSFSESPSCISYFFFFLVLISPGASFFLKKLIFTFYYHYLHFILLLCIFLL